MCLRSVSILLAASANPEAEDESRSRGALGSPADRHQTGCDFTFRIIRNKQVNEIQSSECTNRQISSSCAVYIHITLRNVFVDTVENVAILAQVATMARAIFFLVPGSAFEVAGHLRCPCLSDTDLGGATAADLPSGIDSATYGLGCARHDRQLPECSGT